MMALKLVQIVPKSTYHKALLLMFVQVETDPSLLSTFKCHLSLLDTSHFEVRSAVSVQSPFETYITLIPWPCSFSVHQLTFVMVPTNDHYHYWD